MNNKPEQQLPVNEAQVQIVDEARARTEAVQKAVKYLDHLLISKGIAKLGDLTQGGSTGSTGAPGTGSDAGCGAPVEPKPRIIKTCDCGRAYTHEAWPWLRLVTFQRLEEDLAIELRECAGCHATIGIVAHVVPCHVARMGARP